jgi:hypothetical protein
MSRERSAIVSGDACVMTGSASTPPPTSTMCVSPGTSMPTTT